MEIPLLGNSTFTSQRHADKILIAQDGAKITRSNIDVHRT